MKQLLISLFAVAVLFHALPAHAASDAYQQYIDDRKSKAEAGDAKAQASLGTAYSVGSGVAQSDAEAVKWWRKAAEQGDAQGEMMLGAAYMGGKGVTADKAEAAKWYRKASDGGDPNGKAFFGQLSYEGIGVPQDKPLGMKLMKEAAEQGSTAAIDLLKNYHVKVKVQVIE